MHRVCRAELARFTAALNADGDVSPLQRDCVPAVLDNMAEIMMRLAQSCSAGDDRLRSD